LDLREPEPEKGSSSSSGGKKIKQRNIEQRRRLTEKTPPDMWFEETSAYDENIIENSKGKVIAIDFHPDGSASPTFVTLTNNGGMHITIEVLKATGQIEVTPGTIAEKQEKAQEQVTIPPAPMGGSRG
jgi:hypothetical protein